MATEISSTSHKPLPESWIDRLFERMSAYYGSRFADAWRGTDASVVKRVWAEALGAYSANEIKRGVDSLNGCKWPPTLPEFLLLCRPEADPKADWIEACEQMRIRLEGRQADRWSRPKVYWAAVKIGDYDLRSLGWDAIKTRWLAALNTARTDAIPEYRAQLPQPGQTGITREEATVRVRELGATVGGEAQIDHRAWAKRILANPEKFPSISVQFAKEALGLAESV